MNTLGLSFTRAGFRLLSRISPDVSAQMAMRLLTTPGSRHHAGTDVERQILRLGRRIRVARMAGTVWGDGPTVLLLHGWQRSRASMTGFVGPLVEAGYRVVALDAPAHGQSPGRQLGPYHYADAVLRAGDSLGPLEGSIAHSFGGFALINAIHNGLRVKRAALIAPATTSIASHPQLLSELLKLHPITRQRFFALADQLARSQSVPPDRLGRGLNLPALFLHDPGDQRVAFVDSLLVSERWRGARLEAVPGLGHNRILSDQNVIGAVVMFMAGEAWSDQRGPRLGPFTEARMVTPSDQRVAEAIFHRLQEVV